MEIEDNKDCEQCHNSNCPMAGLQSVMPCDSFRSKSQVVRGLLPGRPQCYNKSKVPPVSPSKEV